MLGVLLRLANRKGSPFHDGGGPVYLDAPAADTQALQVPHPLWLPDGGVAETRKAPGWRGLLSPLALGKKRAPSVVSENASLT